MANYLDYNGVVAYTRLLKGLIGNEVGSAAEQLESLITSEIAQFTDALVFQDLLTAANVNMQNAAYSDASKGDVYIVSPASGSTIQVTYRPTTGTSNVTDTLEAGDTLICIEPKNGNTPAKWGVLQTNLNVSTVSGGAELAGTTPTTVATVAGISIQAKLSKNLGNAAECGVGTVAANSGSLVTGSAVNTAIVNAVNPIKNFTINASDADHGISAHLQGCLTGDGPTLDITATPGCIAASSETSENPNNFVTGAAVYDYVGSKVDTADTAAAAANGISVGLTGKVGNHGLIANVTGGAIGENDNSVVLGSTVYKYNWGGSKSGSYAGVRVSLGGSVGSPTIGVEVGSEAVIAGSTTGHAKDVVLGYQVYNYVSTNTTSDAAMPITLDDDPNSSVEAAYSAGINS